MGRLGFEDGQWDQQSLAIIVGGVLSPSLPTPRVEPMDTWRTRNSVFFRMRAFPAEPAAESFDLVLKCERRWTPELAEGTHAALRRLSDLRRLDPGPSQGISFPEPLGWIPDPPGVVMRHVEGLELFDLLSDPEQPLWEEPTRLAELVRSCGEAFGWIHRLEAIDPETPRVRRQALERVPAAFRWIMSRVADPPPGSVVRSHNFSRNDFLVSPEGILSVLDPPSEGKPAFLHEDLAWFTYQLLERLDRARALHLREVFFEGYASSRPEGRLSRADIRAITICEADRALGTARRLTSKRKVRGAARSLRIAFGAVGRTFDRQ